MIVLTGASSNHYHPVRNLLWSLDHHEPDRRVVVFDLGLSEPELRGLEGREVRRFRFEDYPAHLNFHLPAGRKSNCWKAILVSDFYREAGDTVLWLDAGDLVHGSLDPIARVLDNEGIYTPMDPFKVADFAHPVTLEALGASPEVRARNVHYSGVTGFGPRCVPLLDRWRELSLDPKVIRPEGWNRQQHRSDQIVLSVLLYQMQAQLGYRIVDEMLNVSVLNDGWWTREMAEPRWKQPLP